jgi:hypothetical protein
LLDALALSHAHRQDLHRRGLTEAGIRGGGYRTLTPKGREELALALLYEHREACPGAAPILAVHDEIVVEVDVRDQAKDVEGWLEKAMVDGMDEFLNSGLDTAHPERVPVKVDVEVVNGWGEG